MRGCSAYEQTAVRVFFSADSLHLQDCISDLVTDDVDWRRLNCWLTADTQVRKHKHKFATDSDSGHTIHRLYSVHCLQLVLCWLLLMRQRWQLHPQQLHPQPPSITTPWARNAFHEIFRKPPNQKFLCRHGRLYLLQIFQRMHISFEYALKIGAKGMFSGWSS